MYDKKVSLIEYASFFGSIQVFQYLKLNGVKLNSSLWNYAIHGRNPEMIHILEENNVEFQNDQSYETCLKESIKCHHNEIADYFLNNFLTQEDEKNKIEKNFNKNVFAYAFHYYNYQYFPTDFGNKYVFCYLCKYNYLSIVKFLLEVQRPDINVKIII